MPVVGFDHVAIPIARVREMLEFYERLGFTIDRASPPFYAVGFGDQKINMHAPEAWQSDRFSLRGPTAVPGCGDFCFVWSGGQSELKSLLDVLRIAIVEGPVLRRGGRAGGVEGESIYIRDPDQNLLEFIVYR